MIEGKYVWTHLSLSPIPHIILDFKSSHPFFWGKNVNHSFVKRDHSLFSPLSIFYFLLVILPSFWSIFNKENNCQEECLEWSRGSKNCTFCRQFFPVHSYPSFKDIQTWKRWLKRRKRHLPWKLFFLKEEMHFQGQDVQWRKDKEERELKRIGWIRSRI